MILVPESQIHEYKSHGWWGTQTLIEQLYSKAKSGEDKVVLVDPENKEKLVGLPPRRMTYSQLIQAIDSLALKYVELGVKHDDVIVVQLPNIVELPITILAAARAGAIVSPIPVQWRTHEVRYVVELTQAKIFVATHNFMGFDHVAMARQAIGANGPIKYFISADKVPAQETISMVDILNTKPIDIKQLEGIQTGPDEVFTICWTSGTEAAPKGVPRSHNHWLSISRVVAEGFLPDQDCVYLSLFPTINMAGLGGILFPWLITGGKLVLHQPFDLGVFLKQLVTERVIYTLAPPALLDGLAKSPEWAQMDRGDLKIIGSGSTPLSPWMVKKFQDEFGIFIVNFFGSNEGVALYSSPNDFPNAEDRALYFPRFGVKGLKWTSKAAELIKTKLVDPSTESEITEPGVIGELRIIGPTVFSGYWKAPDMTTKAFDDQGFFRTGDLFSIAGDRNEKYQFQGRHKDLIIRGGMNISPQEIEILVSQHPKVTEVVAVGYPDERLGERICIVVTPKTGQNVTLEEINEFLRGKDIAKYKYPEILRLMESLPRNPLGKVLKGEIREMLQNEVSC
jgi:acyl-CoA synthetase (AMP-forming)/AMP-acid ligase II